MSYAFISEMKNLVYLAVKIFFHSILSIFFRDVDIIGRENIPQFGPVIFTGALRYVALRSVALRSVALPTMMYIARSNPETIVCLIATSPSHALF
jgi:hypothetical protein